MQKKLALGIVGEVLSYVASYKLSLCCSRDPCYQLFHFLQLLGDAILGFLVTTFIFLECEEGLEPKTLFERKRAFVNNQSLVNFSTVELMIVTLR